MPRGSQRQVQIDANQLTALDGYGRVEKLPAAVTLHTVLPMYFDSGVGFGGGLVRRRIAQARGVVEASGALAIDVQCGLAASVSSTVWTADERGWITECVEPGTSERDSVQ